MQMLYQKQQKILDNYVQVNLEDLINHLVLKDVNFIEL